MLVFEKLRYKNLLSSGNTFTEIALNSHPHTLIVGQNGAGKTTLLDALCFVLYGRPFRAINKPNLVNAVNGKQLVVEVEFSTQNNKYTVRRGMKPTVFDIICNGKEVTELPSVNEMQDHLEKYILKCNFKAFTQVVILGASSYVPFMRLVPQARREILEDVLDIEVFSAMQTILKDRLVDTRDKLSKAQADHYVAESQQALVRTYTEQWETKQLAARKAIETAIGVNNEATQKKDIELREVKDQLLADPNPNDVLADLRAKFTKASSLVAKFKNEVSHQRKSHDFFHDNDQCPTCTQEIEPGLKSTKCLDTEQKLAEAEKNLAEVQDIAAALTRKIEKAQEAVKQHNDLLARRKHLEVELSSLDKEFERLKGEHAKTFDSPPAPPEDLGNPDDVKAKVDDLTQQKHVLDQGAILLKDTGIRTRIIAQYLPVINSWVNKYLSALDFPIQFTLDEQFKETIKSRHRDEFSYENFSEGEKRRIDLALVLTWRAVARMKNSVYTNLLIFDEIFDSSLDVAGIEEFMRLLQSLDKGTNVFVISHKDAMTDKFANVLTATKVKGFSEIK